MAAYAAIVSTLSLILALKVHRASSPNVEVDWIYTEPDRKLVVGIHNTGRADVTITAVDLYIERHVITSRSRISNGFGMRIEHICDVPVKLWLRKSKTLTFPARLASHSTVSIQVKNDSIILPTQYPLEELYLNFIARFPAREEPFPPWGGPKVSRSPGGKLTPSLAEKFSGTLSGLTPTYPSSCLAQASCLWRTERGAGNIRNSGHKKRRHPRRIGTAPFHCQRAGHAFMTRQRLFS